MNYIKMSPIVGMSGYGGGVTGLSFSGISVPKWEGSNGTIPGGGNPSNTAVINKFNIASDGNASDHGDLTVARNALASCGGEGRGISGGGHASVNRDYIDYFSFSSAGDASDFGDLTVARNALGACCDAFRAVFVGGADGSVSNDMLGKFFAELNKLAEIAEFTVVPFDTHVDEEKVYVWKKGQRKERERVLCGGTNFDAPTEYVNQRQFDGHIILTDLEAPKPKPSKCQRMWMTTRYYADRPYFKTNERIIAIDT